MKRFWLVALVGAAVIAGCGGREPGSASLTKGSLKVECDEAVGPVMQTEADEFHQLYNEANVSMRTVGAREVIADFVSDSVKLIVTGRPLNKEERDVITQGKIPLQEYRVALAAVAVVTNRESGVNELRMGQLDSILSGFTTTWPGRRKSVIDLVIGGVNSSTNEIVRDVVLKGKAFALSATPMAESNRLLEYVEKTRGTLGIVGNNWLKGMESRVTVVALSIPGYVPDSTQSPGQSYSPAQAYVYKKYYPIITPVYMYTREVSPDIGLGFISFVTSAQGQKIILNSGLVPVTMPVRLVQLTSEQVK